MSTKTISDKITKIQNKSIQNNLSVASKLPVWHDSKRGTPNTFLRSALFSAVQSKDRIDMKGVVLASQAGIIVTYTGEQLNQEDLSVWETLMHLAKDSSLDNICEFTSYEILKTMGLPNGGENHKQLHTIIIRLTACAVQIEHAGKTFFGSLISSGIKDEKTGHYTIKLSKNLIKLYGKTEWTGVNWEQRKALKRKPLAMSLHGYYSSHKAPYPVKLETLLKLSGSKNKQPADFKIKVRKALQNLVDIEFLDSFLIEDNLVSVKKSNGFRAIK